MDVEVVVCFILLLDVSHTAKCNAQCITNNGEELSSSRMEVLPGIGWDNLRNVDMSLVFEYDYTNCQLTNDRKFLIPDGYFAIPNQQSDIETISELFTHWDNHTSLTSTSINTEESAYLKINGKFSYDYIKMKGSMYNDKSIVVRAQVRRKLYTIRLVTGTALHPTFKSRLLDIATYMIHNETAIAQHLSELLVRDYGTHFVSVVHVGAMLVQEDYIKNTFAENFEEVKQTLTASISAKFMDKLGFSGESDFTTDSNSTQSYTSQLMSSHIRTYGGPPYGLNFSINSWDNELEDSLAVIDREGELLHFAITPQSLNELSPMQTQELASYIENAVTQYYKYNTQYGCTNPSSENFYFDANVDDESCKAPTANFTFGGIYQTCFCMNPQEEENTGRLCQQWHLTQINPITGDYTCPPNYDPVLLYSGKKSRSSTSLDVVFYKLFWCVATAKAHDKSGYLFGGLYNSILINPLTQSQLCPNQYYPINFGKDTKLCVSRDYEPGITLTIPFGGFESCCAGNPLAMPSDPRGLDFLRSEPSNWPHRCPGGYTPHLANIEQSCEINYCIKAEILNVPKLSPVTRPPFQAAPNYPNYPISHHFGGSSTHYNRKTIIAIIFISTAVVGYVVIVSMCGMYLSSNATVKILPVVILQTASFFAVTIVEYAILIMWYDN